MRRKLIAAALVLAWLAPSRAAAPLQHQVEAAFLFKFLSFVSWPDGTFASPDVPIVIGVMGAEDILYELQQIVEGRRVGHRAVNVIRVRQTQPLDGLHVLYVGPEVRSPVTKAREKPGLLLVTSAKDTAEQGSVINLVLHEGRVGFEVDLDNADRAGLHVSSRLLEVAQDVRQTSQ